MELVTNAHIWQKISCFFGKINWKCLFWNSTSATIQETCWRRTLYMLVYDTNSLELILFSVLAHTFRVLSRKGWNLLPVFKCNVTVNSVRIDNFYTDFRLQIRCSFQLILNIIQNDGIENPGIRGVKGLIQKIEKKTFQLLLRSPELYWTFPKSSSFFFST